MKYYFNIKLYINYIYINSIFLRGYHTMPLKSCHAMYRDSTYITPYTDIYKARTHTSIQ